MPLVDSKFSNFRSGGNLAVGDIVVGLRGGLNTQFSITGIPPSGVIIPIENGGTGSDTASGARINLGVAIGSDVEAWSPVLDALAALNGTGFVAQIANASFVERVITGTANQINVTNGNGVSGNPTFALSSTLVLPGTLALGGTLNTAGFAITNSVTNGNVQINTNGLGLLVLNSTQGVTGVSNDATLSADSSELIPTQAAVKAYADSISAGLTWITPPAVCATTGDLSGYTYANGVAGVGATLTAGSNGAFSADGVSPALNAVVLVRAQTATEENGIYTLTTVGDGSNPAVLTRATNYDEVSEIVPGSAIAVTGGTTYGGSIFVETATVVTIGTDPIIFIQSSVPASAFVTLSTVQTITGQKTFNSAKLLLAGSGSGSTTLNASATASGTLTLPAATDTLVARATTDTLTNKTISGSANTLSNIAVSSLANGTPGQLITWSAGNAPTTVATGTAGQVLTSNGAGAAPTFQNAVGGTTPTQQVFTSGTGTYTTPAGVRFIVVRMIGGGGGGGGGGVSGAVSGSAGGSSTFGGSLLVCNGGVGGSVGSYGGSGGSAAISAPAYGFAITGSSGGAGTFINTNTNGASFTASGGMGGNSFLTGAGGGGPNGLAGLAASANTGSGGGGGGRAGTTLAANSGAGGGAGGCIQAYIDAPAATYSYEVGTGGAGGGASSYGGPGGAGASGVIIVDEFY